MATRALSVNPALLRWARERSGLSVDQVAEGLDRSSEIITAWENGGEVPTFRQLETLASRFYKVPVAVFFFPAPPAEKPISQEFRTLPASELARLEPDTRFAIREARAWQLALPDLMTGVQRNRPIITQAFQPTTSSPVGELARDVRAFLGVPLERQQSWRDAEHAFKEWRSVVESAGIFVFKRAFEQKEVSGFCLHDELFPLVVVNNSTAHTRQIFTLFHEIGHLLFGISGITELQDKFISSLDGNARSIEVTCNRFAAEFLVPADAFPWSVFSELDLDPAVELTASNFNVSREVILRRLLESEWIDQQTYSRKVAEWAGEYHRGSGSSGGSYYANQGTYLSEMFVTAAFHQYHTGHISIADVAELFNMRAQNVGRFEDFLLSRR